MTAAGVIVVMRLKGCCRSAASCIVQMQWAMLTNMGGYWNEPRSK